MRNQPKYNFFKNASYAFNGIKDMLKTERSFQIELLLFLILLPVLLFLPLHALFKLMIFSSMMLVLIAEAVNSAIERVVDLVTKEHNELAGRAKDVGSAIVLISLILCGVFWLVAFAVIYI